MLGIVGVDNPAEPLGKGGDNRVDNADLVDPVRGIVALVSSLPEQLAGSYAILWQHRLRSELRQDDVHPAHVDCPLMCLDQDFWRDDQDLTKARKCSDMATSRRRVPLGGQNPPGVDRHR